MRAICAALLLVPCMTVSAQEPAVVGHSKWRIGLSGSYGIGHRELFNRSGAAIGEILIDGRNDMEEPAPYVGGNLDILLDIGERWAISSGIQYLNVGYRTKDLTLVPLSASEGLNGATVRYDHRYRYLSIPLLVRFRIGNGRFRFEPALGLSGDLLRFAYSDVTITYGNGSVFTSRSEVDSKQLSALNLSGILELNLCYAFGERWGIRLAPTARQQFLWMSDTPITERLRGAGITTGIEFRL
ncbi:MAG: outer membrane beta-barrel protein [Flavobacteriales bacterium]|nr:outer membrane beta-barrel protein [Flavobacteriales bacterium]